MHKYLGKRERTATKCRHLHGKQNGGNAPLKLKSPKAPSEIKSRGQSGHHCTEACFREELAISSGPGRGPRNPDRQPPIGCIVRRWRRLRKHACQHKDAPREGGLHCNQPRRRQI